MKSKWEIIREDAEIWIIDLAICAAVVGLTYSFGKNLCDKLFQQRKRG